LRATFTCRETIVANVVAETVTSEASSDATVERFTPYGTAQILLGAINYEVRRRSEVSTPLRSWRPTPNGWPGSPAGTRGIPTEISADFSSS
jgi:hypothetical protein